MSDYDPDPMRLSEGEGEQYDPWMDHPCRQLVEHEVAEVVAAERKRLVEVFTQERDRRVLLLDYETTPDIQVLDWAIQQIEQTT